MSSSDPNHLQRRGRLLDEAYFAERDRALMSALQDIATAEEAQRELASAIGIADEITLKAIARVESEMPVLAATALLPMVEVAWCDGAVESRERDAVLQAASEMGIPRDSTVYEILRSWLEVRPSPEAVDAWRNYVQAISVTLDPAAAASLKQAILGRAEKVAAAAGGYLGLTSKISALERACLDDLARAFPE